MLCAERVRLDAARELDSAVDARFTTVDSAGP